MSLRQYLGQWVVLYFYPKDQTTGCTIEARKFDSDQPEYARRDVVVLGVSLDSVESHKGFCTKERLRFKLLADTEYKVTMAYGSLLNLGFIKLARRHTFIISPSGRIAKVYDTVDPAQHSTEVLAALDQLQSETAS